MLCVSWFFSAFAAILLFSLIGGDLRVISFILIRIYLKTIKFSAKFAILFNYNNFHQKQETFQFKHATLGFKLETFQLKHATLGFKHTTFQLKHATLGFKLETFQPKHATLGFKLETFQPKHPRVFIPQKIFSLMQKPLKPAKYILCNEHIIVTGENLKIMLPLKTENVQRF